MAITSLFLITPTPKDFWHALPGSLDLYANSAFFTTISIFVELISAFQRIVFSLISIGVYSCSKLLHFGLSLKNTLYEPLGKDKYFPNHLFLYASPMTFEL